MPPVVTFFSLTTSLKSLLDLLPELSVQVKDKKYVQTVFIFYDPVIFVKGVLSALSIQVNSLEISSL